jgi:two-component system, OmpR family, response regulator AdeR
MPAKTAQPPFTFTSMKPHTVIDVLRSLAATGTTANGTTANSRSDPSPIMDTTPLILIVEDEPHIAQVLDGYLRRDGFRTELASDGEKALALHQASRPDLLLLDVKLPKLDGFEVLRRIRERGDHSTPVIMVTAMAEDLDKLLGLRLGADDYVVKPFSPLEVVARVKAVLRRATPKASSQAPLRLGRLEIDHQATLARVDDQRLDLTLTEFKLLEHLCRNRRRTFSRSELLEAALPESDALERAVDAAQKTYNCWPRRPD